MAASVAHEIRNPLGAIEGFARLLQSDLADAPDSRRLAEKISHGARQLDCVVNNLLNYAREMRCDFQQQDLGVIIDDVITAGTSIKESVDIIIEQGATPSAVVIAVDRQERAGDALQSAVQSIQETFGIPVYSIINLDDIVAYSESSNAVPNPEAVAAYREQYGVRSER